MTTDGNNIETYINAKDIPQNPFRIEQAYKPDFGKFLAVRWLYSITVTSGKTWQKVLFFLSFTFFLSPLALAADLCGLVLYGSLLLAKRILEGLLLAVLNIGQTVISKFLGTAVTIGALIGTTLIIYYQWDAITNFINSLL